MNQYIKKLLVAGLGAAAILLCAPAQTAFAAPQESLVSEETAKLAAAAMELKAPALTAESVGYDAVTLAWEAANDVHSYELQQSADQKNYTTVATLTTDQELRYTVTGLFTARTYYYRLVVTDAKGASAASEALKVKTVLPSPTLTVVEAVAADQVALSWTPVDGAVFYRVYRSTTQTGGFQSVKTVYGTSYTNKVTTGVTYYYKIMPLRYNPDGKKVRGKCSATHSITANMSTPVISAVVNSANNSLTVNWSAVAGAEGYAIYRSLEKSKGYKVVKTLGGECTSWVDTTVEPGEKYYYKICIGKTVDGNLIYGAKSAAKSRWTVSAAPSDLRAVQNDNGVVLSWTPSKAATSYRIYRAQGTQEQYMQIAEKVKGSSYTDSGLVSGETYFYRMEAVHGSLVSEKSQSASVSLGAVKANTRTLFLGVGQTLPLTATSELSGTVGWSSADESIAVVSADGQVTGLAQGQTKVTASVGGVTTSVTVTVTDCQLNGIDVSKWQQAINWKTVKESGIQFAMLRLAHGTSKDIQFETYYTGAMEQGIPVGIYCYTLAKSVDEGIAEAEYLLELLDGKELAYPIALDLESENQIKNMNKAARTELILEYKRIIEEAGYQFVVYANLNWLNNYIDQTKLAEENVDIWIARYRSQSLGHGYTGGGNVRMWQYSSTGQVDGILDAFGRYINVDLDVCYDGY